MMRRLAKSVMPAWVIKRYRATREARRKAAVDALPPLIETQFRALLTDEFELAEGDVVFVHSSADYLKPGFSLMRVLPILLETVGESGTLVFPTYPELGSYDFLREGKVFDVRRTPSYMGMLSELARRHPRAVRSLHPTKSVCAIGPAAEAITEGHHEGVYPFGPHSPHYKLVKYEARIVGLAVSTRILSFVHCVEDVMGSDFPVATNHPELFEAKCVNAEGREVTVQSYAHNLDRMEHNIPRFMARHIPDEVCREFTTHRRRFYHAYAAPLFERMTELARRGVTIYPRRHYKRGA